jgi:hypothetical protein
MDKLLRSNEVIIKKGKANSFTAFLARGGHLAVTNQRVLWKGHTLNLGIGTQSEAIELEDIAAYGKCFTMLIYSLFLPIPNAIYISTKSGEKYKYTVFGRKIWIDTLEKAIEDNKKNG